MWTLKFVLGVNHHKCILFVLNFLILVFALTLIVRAVVLKTSTAGLDIEEVSNFALALGAIIGVVAIIGCWGVIKENPCHQTIYASVLLIFLCIQLPFIILTFLLGAKSAIGKVVPKYLSTIYNERNDTQTLKHINDFHQSLRCCGLTGPNGREVTSDSVSIMRSCCNEPVVTCTHDLAFPDSCTDKVIKIVAANLDLIGIVALIFVIFELACALFVFFARSVDRERDDIELLI